MKNATAVVIGALATAAFCAAMSWALVRSVPESMGTVYVDRGVARTTVTEMERPSEQRRQAVACIQLPTEGVIEVETPDDLPAVCGRLTACNTRLEHENAKLRLALDECKNDRYSVLGTMRSLPEWPDLNEADRRSVVDFLEHYPIKLSDGEGTFIATYRCDGCDRMAYIVGTMRARILAVLNPEQTARFLEDYP